MPGKCLKLSVTCFRWPTPSPRFLTMMSTSQWYNSSSHMVVLVPPDSCRRSLGPVRIVSRRDILYNRVLVCCHETWPVNFHLSRTSCCCAVLCPDVLIGATIYWPLHGRTVAHRLSAQLGAVWSGPRLRSRILHSAFLVRIPILSYVRVCIRHCHAVVWLLHSCTTAVQQLTAQHVLLLCCLVMLVYYTALYHCP